MPTFVAALLGGLAASAGSLAGRVLLSLGFGFVAYQGIDTLLNTLKALLLAQVTAMGAQAIQLLSLLKVGVAINMIFSAIAVRLIIQGLTSGIVKRLVAH